MRWLALGVGCRGFVALTRGSIRAPRRAGEERRGERKGRGSEETGEGWVLVGVGFVDALFLDA